MSANLRHLYFRRADLIGTRHGIPGIGSLRKHLTPPRWVLGQNPLTESQVEELYEESRAKAANDLDEEVEGDECYAGQELIDRQSLREEKYEKSLAFDEVILKERIEVYKAWKAAQGDEQQNDNGRRPSDATTFGSNQTEPSSASTVVAWPSPVANESGRSSASPKSKITESGPPQTAIAGFVQESHDTLHTSEQQPLSLQQTVNDQPLSLTPSDCLVPFSPGFSERQNSTGGPTLGSDFPTCISDNLFSEAYNQNLSWIDNLIVEFPDITAKPGNEEHPLLSCTVSQMSPSSQINMHIGVSAPQDGLTSLDNVDFPLSPFPWSPSQAGYSSFANTIQPQGHLTNMADKVNISFLSPDSAPNLDTRSNNAENTPLAPAGTLQRQLEGQTNPGRPNIQTPGRSKAKTPLVNSPHTPALKTMRISDFQSSGAVKRPFQDLQSSPITEAAATPSRKKTKRAKKGSTYIGGAWLEKAMAEAHITLGTPPAGAKSKLNPPRLGRYFKF